MPHPKQNISVWDALFGMLARAFERVIEIFGMNAS